MGLLGYEVELTDTLVMKTISGARVLSGAWPEGVWSQCYSAPVSWMSGGGGGGDGVVIVLLKRHGYV